MILSYISFFVGLILLIFLPALINNSNLRVKLNRYFIVIIVVAGLQRFGYGLQEFGIIKPLIKPFNRILTFAFFIPPVYLISVENLLNKKTTIKKEITLFGIAAVIVLVTKLLRFSKVTNQILFFIYSTTYLGILLYQNYRVFTTKKNTKELHEYTIIKKWSLVMLVLFTTIYISANYTIYSFIQGTGTAILNRYYNLTSLIWLSFVLYLLMNPINLYGENVLYKKLIKPALNEIQIWKTNKKTKTEPIDLDIEEKVNAKLENILFDIKKFEVNLFTNFNKVPTLKELAAITGHPQSHLKYIFKYYSYYTFSEYQNVLKVKYSLQLIRAGYLKTQTVDSLSTKCMFNSRITFFNNFKKLVGYSPTDFVLTISDT
jgi:AraC-like DNA-binding protein